MDSEEKAIKATRRSQLDSDPSSKLPDLPFEIITEILLRLPVKSLVRFSCVSKPWLSLISSPEFINRHLTSVRASEEDKEHQQRLLILGFDVEGHHLVHCSLKSLTLRDRPDDAAPIETVEIDYPPIGKPSYLEIVGCYNGLFCVNLDEDELFLWNPSTRKSKKLPNLDDLYVNLKENYYYYTNYGFGYDRVSDDYKVVALSCFGHNENDDFFESDVMVYSAKTESWRSIGGFQAGIPMDEIGCIYLNDKLHWASAKEELFDSIVFFDLTTETCGSLDLPDEVVMTTSEVGLGTLGGCLSFICSHYQDNVENMWVMKEYGVKNSWTKLLSIPLNLNTHLSAALDRVEGGSFLLIQEGNLQLYDPKGSSSRLPLELVVITAANVYAESMVSPYSSNALEMNNNNPSRDTQKGLLSRIPSLNKT